MAKKNMTTKKTMVTQVINNQAVASMELLRTQIWIFTVDFVYFRKWVAASYPPEFSIRSTSTLIQIDLNSICRRR